MLFLSRYAIRAPTTMLASTAILLIVAGFGLLDPRLETGGEALVPLDDPTVVADKALRERFGLHDTITILVRAETSILEPAPLALIRDLSEAANALDWVADAWSLATERGPRVSRETGFRMLLDPFPEDDAARARLREELARLGLYAGLLYAPDDGAAAIHISLETGTPRARALRELRELVARHDDGRFEIDIIGPPVAESLLGNTILADLGVPAALIDLPERSSGHLPLYRRIGLVPLALLVMVAVFLLAFRKPLAAILPLVEVGACLVVVFGVMGFFGVPIYLTTVVLPVILTAVGIADEVHLFHRYGRLARERPDLGDGELVEQTMREMTAPIIQTSVTTAIGFLSFAVSPLTPVRVFGLFTALGVLVCMIFSLAVVPALLVLLGRKHLLTEHRIRTPLRISFSAPRSVTARWVMVGLTILFIAAGLGELRVGDSWIDAFDPRGDFGRAMTAFDADFEGMHRLYIELAGKRRVLETEIEAATITHPELRLVGRLEADAPADLIGDRITLSEGPGRTWQAHVTDARRVADTLILTWRRIAGNPVLRFRAAPQDRLTLRIEHVPMENPSVMSRAAGFEAFTSEQDGVGGVLGPARYLSTVMRATGTTVGEGGDPLADPQEIEYAWLNFTAMRGARRAAQAVSPDHERALITVFLEHADYETTARLLDAIDRYAERRLEPAGLEISLGGDVMVSQTLIQGVVETQIRSLALSLLAILVVASLLRHSIAAGFLCTLPPAVAVLVSLAAMGFLDIRLGVATSMFAGMTLGVGVDFAIHYLTRYERARRHGARSVEAVTTASTETRGAITIDALAVSLGFAVLMGSRIPGNARLGFLLVASVLTCLIATLLILPSLLSASD